MLAIRPKTNHRQKRRWGLSSSRQTRQTLPRSEKKRKENAYVCALREKRARYLIQKKNKNHSPNASSIARRAGHSSTLSLLREKTILSAQISKSYKERKFVPRLRSLHARAVAFTTRNETFRLKDYSFCCSNKNRAHKKKTRAARKRRP